MLFFGDADFASVVKNGPIGTWPHPWLDAKRGTIPIVWDFDSHLMDWAPDIMDWFYRHRSSNDWFLSGDSGPGYLNPDFVPTAERSKWSRFGVRWNRACGYQANVWLLGGNAGYTEKSTIDMYLPFSGDGVIDTQWMDSAWPYSFPYLQNNLPVGLLSHVGFGAGQTVSACVPEVHNGYDRSRAWHSTSEPHFLVFRGVEISPSWWVDLINQAKAEKPERNYTVVDPYTFFYLMRRSLNGSNNYRATWLGDTIPINMNPGQTYTGLTVTVRNDGWDTWKAAWPNNYRLGISGFSTTEIAPAAPPTEPYNIRADLSVDIAPGQTATFTNISITAPSSPGTYYLQYDMVQEGITWLETQRNIPWQGVFYVGASQPTNTPTKTSTRTSTPIPTSTYTSTRTFTYTPTRTPTLTYTATRTNTPITPEPTSSYTSTRTPTYTFTATMISTNTPTLIPSSTPKPYTIGDPNCDGSLTPGDALLAFQIYLRIYVPSGDELCDVSRAADQNQDGNITPGDALCVFREYLRNPC